MDGLTVGRIVHYVLNENDAQVINASREAAQRLLDDELRVPGTQYHVGNPVEFGQHCAMIITAVFNDQGLVNGKILLDGYDNFWVISRPFNDQKQAFSWHWIEKA